jgi:type II secretory pathway pseudopilin PulG
MPRIRDRRRAQAGTTLVELLVALSIAAFALAIIVGTLSSGLLQSTISKRNTAVQAVIQYEMEQVGASAFSGSASPYSDCFATEAPTDPAAATGYQLDCPSGPYSLRADVTWQWLPSSSTVQVWTITVRALPSGDAVGTSVQTYKVTHS